MLRSIASAFAVVLVGSRALLREGLARILSAAEFNVAATASSIEEIPPISSDQPILLVLEVGDNDLATVRNIRLFKERFPGARIALLADPGRQSDNSILTAFEAGAHAYFTEPTCAAFIKSLELVMLGEIIVPPTVMSHLGQRHEETTGRPWGLAEAAGENGRECPPRLSAREVCILRRLIAGDSNKMIARDNAIAEATVKVHVKAILRKIRVSNRTQAAIWGILNGGLVEGLGKPKLNGTSEIELRAGGDDGDVVPPGHGVTLGMQIRALASR